MRLLKRWRASWQTVLWHISVFQTVLVFHDPHYHVYVVNWLPRIFSESFIKLFKRQKDYKKDDAGIQKLSDMHYMTRGAFEKLCKKHGLIFIDSREEKVAKQFPYFAFILRCVYRMYAFLFISTHHGFLRNKSL